MLLVSLSLDPSMKNVTPENFKLENSVLGRELVKYLDRLLDRTVLTYGSDERLLS